MTRVVMSHVRKTFGESIALEDFSITFEPGDLVCLLGPSGCGKTTALRILAGFENADSGSVTVNGEDITKVPVSKRRFGMVFQDYSLFPNMTSRENIDFGLKAQKRSSIQRKEIIDRMLSITALEDQADKFPHQMSGGQKQRVALARAIATEPTLLLLDEPLSALDAKVRESLRDEIRRLQKEIGVTTVFVTHDQDEALAIADQVGVMSRGLLEQIATPRELYEHPINPFVASFIGSINKLDAIAGDHGMWGVLNRWVSSDYPSVVGDTALLGIRPEELAVDAASDGNARITDISFLGPVTRVTLEFADHSNAQRSEVIADLMSADCSRLHVGERVQVRVRDDVMSAIMMSKSEDIGVAGSGGIVHAG